MVTISSESAFLREVFIESFVNKTSNCYKTTIEQKHLFSDGLCYTGYLWDCLITHTRVSLNFSQHFLQNRGDLIYVFWDIHSKDLIHIDDYWKYPKDAVLIVAPHDIIDVIPTLPDDCYFFDQTLSWAIALTHEELNYKKRLCYYIGK